MQYNKQTTFNRSLAHTWLISNKRAIVLLPSTAIVYICKIPPCAIIETFKQPSFMQKLSIWSVNAGLMLLARNLFYVQFLRSQLLHALCSMRVIFLDHIFIYLKCYHAQTPFQLFNYQLFISCCYLNLTLARGYLVNF